MKTFVLEPVMYIPKNDANQAIDSLVGHFSNNAIVATIMTNSAGPFVGKIEGITDQDITIRHSEDDEEPVVIARRDITEFTSDISRVGRLAVA